MRVWRCNMAKTTTTSSFTDLPSAKNTPWWLTASPEHASDWRVNALIAVFLIGIYITALLGLWPGILGSDSFAILKEVIEPSLHFSGKTSIWYHLVSNLFLINDRVENVSIFLIAVSTLVFTRILSWLWLNQPKWIFFLCLLGIVINPQMVRYTILIYPDGIFSVALIGVLFECYLIIRRQRVSIFSWIFLALLLPFALDLRTNGRVLLILPIVFIPIIRKGQRWSFVAAYLVGLSLCLWSNISHGTSPQKATQSLVIWETVNFLQPRPQEHWRAKPRVSETTIRTLEKYTTIDTLLKYYDPYYWDPLIFPQDGPKLASMSRADQKVLQQEFWRYNLWQNLPAFFGSRVNVFLGSALADGLHVPNNYRAHVLSTIRTNSKANKFDSLELGGFMDRIHAWSENNRIWLWSTLPGTILILYSLYIGIHYKNPIALAISSIMFIELAGIFLMSIAAEHRYHLPLFVFPLVALPLLWDDRRRRVAKNPPSE